MKHTHLLFGLSLLTGLQLSCTPAQEPLSSQSNISSHASVHASALASATPVPSPSVAYSEVFRITYASCLPCHNRHTLPQVIDRLKAAKFSTVDGEDRVRILTELEGLKALQDSGSALGFSSGQEELMDLFESVPGGFFIMLEKGVMPPPWAPALMEAIDWPNYERLSIENRVKLLQFAKPYSQKYLP
ncbi:MAG: hypothetical protein AB7I41_10080 [Candidatus Sericytochromatia bacterium]